MEEDFYEEGPKNFLNLRKLRKCLGGGKMEKENVGKHEKIRENLKKTKENYLELKSKFREPIRKRESLNF